MQFGIPILNIQLPQLDFEGSACSKADQRNILYFSTYWKHSTDLLEIQKCYQRWSTSTKKKKKKGLNFLLE